MDALPSKTNLVNILPHDVKYSLLEDLGIGYESRNQYIETLTDEQLISLIVKNVAKGSRGTVVLDYLVNVENQRRTDTIIVENRRLTKYTVVMSVTSVVVAITTMISTLVSAIALNYSLAQKTAATASGQTEKK